MKIQEYTLKDIDCFNLKDTFQCGQCFRWEENEDASYTGIVRQNVINIRKIDNNEYQVRMLGNEDIEKLVYEYFDLNRDYGKIQNKLSCVDENMKTSIKYGQGIRLLNQDLWEILISFIISANNNIPRIQKIIKRLAESYGKPIDFLGNVYYTFPTPEELKDVTISEFRELGLGFRDKRIYETTQKILKKEVDLKKLECISNTQEVRNILLTLPGVGPKVADCILLFSTLKRLEVFPIDVWVNRVMNELYIHGKEDKINKNEVLKLAEEKFGNLAGIAQQYLFYWRREQEKN